MEKNYFISNQDNKFLIDWFSFSSPDHSVHSILDFLGLSDLKFHAIYGMHFYKDRLYFDGISIHYNSDHNEGIWVEMSGQGCRNFETYSKISFTDLIVKIMESPAGEFHISRVDIAYDDFKGVIPLRKLFKQTLKKQYVSEFHEKSILLNVHPGFEGITVDLGSRKSDVKFRVYDKAYQLGYLDEIHEDNFHWVRWEAQLRNDRAANFLLHFYSGASLGETFKGLIKNYFRPVDVNRSDSNKRRWNTSKWFYKFIGDVEKINLFTKCTTEYNLFKLENYVYQQCGNAVDTLIKIKGIDQFMADLVEKKPETSAKYKELYNQYLNERRKYDRLRIETCLQNGQGILDYLNSVTADKR